MEYKQIVNEDYIAKEENPIKQSDIYKLAEEFASSSNNKKSENNYAMLIVDAQRDFIDAEKGALPVRGAKQDISRITKFIFENINSISAIYTTIDTHRYDAIFHPCLWKDKEGNDVKPFTEITIEKIENKEVIPVFEDIQIDYVKTLKSQGSQNLIVWPYHCIYATDGWLIEKQLSNMLLFYERAKNTSVNRIVKGTDKFSEMYGAIKQEVVSKYTSKNSHTWIYTMKDYDKIYICGEAKDYCVYETVKQLCEEYDSNVRSKLYVMMNCCSSIGDEIKCNLKYKELSKKYGINLIEI